jgi:hypothetical protein
MLFDFSNLGTRRARFKLERHKGDFPGAVLQIACHHNPHVACPDEFFYLAP